ncbi:unnamed protein product [Vitrella brassicaformis CCMP3155]|uniref:MORN repeat-containing protein n=1 Tax=Vitrella brassicaformis (strain CCMP3155) TaxID=1169540 RepID=A0A0G4G5Q1_VITBC|nr:unnamed protein product [Vitrella brassicaformis CCMP3155]|eukprot:CEM23799.1 unnamed protein product [Vitrella brassicaformis CCMP3155]
MSVSGSSVLPEDFQNILDDYRRSQDNLRTVNEGRSSELQERLQEMRESRDQYKAQCEELKGQVKSLTTEMANLRAELLAARQAKSEPDPLENVTRHWEVDGQAGIYKGQWRNEKPHGKGVLWSLDEQTKRYEGDWVAGHLHGKAKSFFHDGKQQDYDGEWQKGIRHGKGTLYLGDGKKRYEGEWAAGQYNGKGTLYFTDGHKEYEGEFKSGCFNRSGELNTVFHYYYPGGHQPMRDFRTFKGAFTNGDFLGDGDVKNMAFNDGTYSGQVRNHKPHGNGMWNRCEKTGSGHERYNGAWIDGVYHGHGTKRNKDGVQVSDVFANGEFLGDGECVELTITGLPSPYYAGKYSGQLKDHKPCGNGRFVQNCNSSLAEMIYSGEWKGGLPDGKGSGNVIQARNPPERYKYNIYVYNYQGDFIAGKPADGPVNLRATNCWKGGHVNEARFHFEGDIKDGVLWQGTETCGEGKHSVYNGAFGAWQRQRQ